MVLDRGFGAIYVVGGQTIARWAAHHRSESPHVAVAVAEKRSIAARPRDFVRLERSEPPLRAITAPLVMQRLQRRRFLSDSPFPGPVLVVRVDDYDSQAVLIVLATYFMPSR